jgi:hypothetical protein
VPPHPPRRHSLALRALAALLLPAALAVAAFRAIDDAGARVAPADSPPPAALAAGTFHASFHGVAADGRDLVWLGPAEGDAPGEMRILLADRGEAIESNRAVWEVEGVVFVSGAPGESLAADVVGTVDWRAGALSLHGVVTVGRLRGAAFEAAGDVEDLELRGRWRAERTVAARTVAAR